MLNLILFVSVRVFAYSTDIDECASGPCQNGGTCVDQVNGYQCHCAPGYTDLQCQTGKCFKLIETVWYFRTSTPEVRFLFLMFLIDISIRRCNSKLTWFIVDIDECASGPCQNSGTCTDLVNGYLCQCAPGYADIQCQTGKFYFILYSSKQIDTLEQVLHKFAFYVWYQTLTCVTYFER